MSYKETIIIAVILNIGILALLLTFATKNEETVERSQVDYLVTDVSESFQTSTPVAASNKISIDALLESGTDEVDIVLKDLALASSDLLDDDFSLPLPPTAAFNSDDYVEVTVKRGDALEKIARANGTTIEAIKQANRMTSDRLSVGQVLLIPVQPRQATSSATAVARVTPSVRAEPAHSKPSDPSQVYLVKSGDNPWKIARQFHISVDDLLRANNLDQERAKNLKIGQPLKIPHSV